MGEINRKRIGIIFNFDKSWLGGIYYIINIIKSLNYLDDIDKPNIILFYNENLKEFLDKIEYPYLEAKQVVFPSVYKGYIKSFIKRENLFIKDILSYNELDGLYPVNDQPCKSRIAKNKNVKIASWFPDLQHKFYPEFFKKKKLFFRELKLKLLLKNSPNLVVSSNDVESHFHQFYNLKKSLKISVLPFVSMIDSFDFESLKVLKEKYKIPDEYYMVSNQFYKHKNHITVLRALSLLKQKNITNVHVVMTGKMEHYNNPEFINQLRNEIRENDLTPYLSMLDVIPRFDQLSLMKHAKAVIQPSLFEGWSTVIEDAKSLQVPVLASNIDIHKEQLGGKGSYFSPLDAKELAELMINYVKTEAPLYSPYKERVKEFATNFIRKFS